MSHHVKTTLCHDITTCNILWEPYWRLENNLTMSTVSLKDVFAELNVFFRHSQFVVAVVKGQQDVGHMDISRILWCFYEQRTN